MKKDEKAPARESETSYPRHVKIDPLSLSWWRVVFAKGGRAFALGCALVFILPIVIGAGISFHSGQSGQPTLQSGTIATVNGQPITTQVFESIPSDYLSGAPGDAHASAYGRAINELIAQQIEDQIAKKLKVHATDADVDRAVAKARETKVGPNASSTEWENYLSDQLHTTASEFRDSLQGQADTQALVDHYKNAEKVTIDDAKNQYSEVKLSTVYIGTQSRTSSFPGAPKSLPDAEALKKATELHAKVIAGADIIPMAKANPSPFDPAKTTGISDWRKEDPGTQFGYVQLYGKDMDDAIIKTPKGQVTDVVKATGFMTGYVFAKVADRRIELPKDYDVNKVIASLKEQRAYKKLSGDIKAATKAAKIVFSKDQPDMKAYYDYAKLQEMQQEMSGGMNGPSPNPPTPAELDAQKQLVDSEFETFLKAHPDDSTAELIVAQTLRTKMATSPPADQAKIRDRLISLYDAAFKTTEDVPTRFVLAGLYHDKQDYKDAYKQYAMVIKLTSEDPSYDMSTRQKELDVRNQLLTGLNGLPAASVPEAAGAAADQTAKIVVLKEKLAADQAKQKAEQEQQAAQQKLAKLKADKDAKDAAAKQKSAPAPTKGGAAAPTSSTTAPAPPVTGGAPGAIPSATTGATGTAAPAPKK